MAALVLASGQTRLPGATVLEQARAREALTLVNEACWAAVGKAYGEADSTRALIEVLMP